MDNRSSIFKPNLIIVVYFLPLVEIGKFKFRTVILIGVLNNDLNHIIHHIELILLPVFVLQVQRIAIGFLRLVLAEVRVYPNTDLTTLVNQNLTLRDEETPHLLIQLLVSTQHGHHAVEIIRIGNILIVAEPGPAVLQIYISGMRHRTKLLAMLRNNVMSAYNVGFVLAKLYRLNIELIILFAEEVESISIIEHAVNTIPDNHVLLVRSLMHLLAGHFFKILGIDMVLILRAFATHIFLFKLYAKLFASIIKI